MMNNRVLFLERRDTGETGDGMGSPPNDFADKRGTAVVRLFGANAFA